MIEPYLEQKRSLAMVADDADVRLVELTSLGLADANLGIWPSL